MSSVDFTTYDALTFDCYGTLIDWETGILNALKPLLAAHAIEQDDETLLEGYARHEAALEAGPYLIYHDAREHLLPHLTRNGDYENPQNELLIFDRIESVWDDCGPPVHAASMTRPLPCREQ